MAALERPVSNDIYKYLHRLHCSSIGGSGAFERNTSRRVSSIFSSGSARKKWRDLEKKVSARVAACMNDLSRLSLKVFNAVLRRQTMANLAKDMDMWIEKRDQLSRKIDELKKQKQLVVQSEVCTM